MKKWLLKDKIEYEDGSQETLFLVVSSFENAGSLLHDYFEKNNKQFKRLVSSEIIAQPFEILFD